MPNRLWRQGRHLFLLVLLLLFATSCVGGGYVHKSRGARRAFQQGRYERALSWYRKQNPPKQDRLLYLLDEGVILHSAGRYRESLQVFDQAMELSDSLGGAQAFSKTAAVVSNDNYIPYQGEQFERLLMQIFQILNYLGLEEYQEALVEVRRLHNRFGDFFHDGNKDYLRNAFATYLSGLIWESNGKLNDAYIDYKKTYRINGSFSELEQDLLRGSKLLGFLSEHQRWKRLFKSSYESHPKDHGEVILIVEAGRMPEKRSTEQRHSLQVIPVPYYPSLREEPNQITLAVEHVSSRESRTPNNERHQTIPLYHVDMAAAKTLDGQMPGIIARGLARLAVKEGGAVATGKKVDKDLGIFLGFILLATNRADLRSWLTLPRSLQVAKFSLPAGTYTLTLKWPGGTRQLDNVNVEAKRKRFVTVRVF